MKINKSYFHMPRTGSEVAAINTQHNLCDEEEIDEQVR